MIRGRFYDAPFSAAPTVMPNGNIVIGGQNHELHVVAFNGSALWMRKVSVCHTHGVVVPPSVGLG